MQRIKIVGVTIALIISSNNIFSQDIFDEISSEIIAADPAFTAEKLNLESQIQALKAGNRLDDPEIGFTYKWGANTPENKWELSVSQAFEWPGAYGARSQAIQHRKAEYLYGYEAFRKKRLAEIRLALVEYVAAKRRYTLYETFSKNTDSIYTHSKTAYDHRELTILDFRKIKIERELARAHCLEAKAEMITAKKRIETLNGGSPLSLEHLVDYPSETIAEFNTSSVPEFQSLKSAAEAAEAEYKAAKRGMFPGFSLGYVHETEGKDHFNGLTVGVTLPVWRSHSEAIAKKLLAEAALESAQADLRNIEIQYNSDRNMAMTYLAEADALSESLGNDAEYIQLLDKALRGGTIRVFEYFSELNKILETRLTIESLRFSAARIAEEARKFTR